MAVPSFPDVHISGPVHHFVRANYGSGNRDIFYLGTAEVTPQMQVRRYRTNTMNDLAGKTLPFQKHWDGEAAVVSVLLTRFSKFAEEHIQASGSGSGLQVDAGGESRWARGAAVYGQASFELWQVYDNGLPSTPAFAVSPGLETGWYWPQVELLQRDTPKVGTQGEGLLLVFDCTPYWDQNGDFFPEVGERGWVLFRQNFSYFPEAVLTPQ